LYRSGTKEAVSSDAPDILAVGSRKMSNPSNKITKLLAYTAGATRRALGQVDQRDLLLGPVSFDSPGHFFIACFRMIIPKYADKRAEMLA
jgi:hypothetical protein